MKATYILFSDLKGFSRLNEANYAHFYEQLLPALAARLRPCLERATMRNTWGDAILAVFEDGLDAVRFALELRDFFAAYDFSRTGYAIQPRIAGHYGAIQVFQDDLLASCNIIGTNVNAAARLEPVTRAGQVFVSRDFHDSFKRLGELPGLSGPDGNTPADYAFDPVGCMVLAKNFGEMDVYRLRKKEEARHPLDRICAMRFDTALPEPVAMSAKERALMDDIERMRTVDVFTRYIAELENDKPSGDFLVSLADKCKSVGLYEKALEFIDRAEKEQLEFNDIVLHPHQSNKKLTKIKVNCLTRLGRYQEAAQHIYNLRKCGHNDIDTLCMLAAQYKRKAVFQPDGTIKPRAYDNILLTRARDLYLHAFSMRSDDYYPAINAAYLCKILDLPDIPGSKIAAFISSYWKIAEATDWWLASTLAEAELLQDDYTLAEESFKSAIERFNPDVFERKSTSDQITIYGTLTDRSRNLATILALLA